MKSRKAERRLRLARYGERFRRAVPAVVWISAVAGVLTATILRTPQIFCRAISPDYLDMVASPLQTGDGVIEAITVPPCSRDGCPDPVARIRLAGREIETLPPPGARIGEQVRVTYRRGKSGALYAGKAERLRPDARP